MSVRDPSRRKALKYGVMAALGLGAGVALGEVTGADRLVHAASPSGSDPVFSGTGIQFPSLTSDPSQLVGNMWYRSDLTAMKYSDGTNAHQLAALDLAQTWTGVQTFNGGMIFNGAGSIAVTSTFIEGTGAGGSIFVNVPTGQEIVNTIDGVRVTLTDINGLYPSTKDDTYVLGTATWRWASVNSVLFNVYHASGDVNPSFQGGDQYLHLGPGGGTSLIAGAGIVFTPVSATSTSTLQNSLVEDLFGSYWNSSASVPYGFRLYSVQDSTTPTAHLSFNLNDNGNLTELVKLDQTGALTLSGNGIVFNAAGSLPTTSTFIEADGAGGNLILNVPNGKIFTMSMNGGNFLDYDGINLYSPGSRNLGKSGYEWNDIISTGTLNVYNVSGASFPTAQLGNGTLNLGTGTAATDTQINRAAAGVVGLPGFKTAAGGTAPTTVSLTSGTAYTASTTQNMIVIIGGGTVTAIAINGTTTGLIAGAFYLKASDTITVTFTTAPTALQMVA